MVTVRVGSFTPVPIFVITTAPAVGNDGGGGGGGGGGVVVVVTGGGGGGGGGVVVVVTGGGGGGLFGADTVNAAMPDAPAVVAVEPRTVTSSLPPEQNVDPVHGTVRSVDVPAVW